MIELDEFNFGLTEEHRYKRINVMNILNRLNENIRIKEIKPVIHPLVID